MKAEGKPLERQSYLALEKPSEREPVRYFSSVENGLYGAVLNMCAVPGKMCMNEMMHIDAMGGAGKESHANRERLEYDNRYAEQGVEAPGPRGGSGRESHSREQPEGMKPKSIAPDVKPGSAPEHSGHDHSGHDHSGHDHGGPAGDGKDSKGSDPVAPGQLNR